MNKNKADTTEKQKSNNQKILTDKKNENPSAFWFSKRIQITILVIAILGIYFPVFDHEFTNYDDITLIQDNYTYFNKISNFPDIFSKGVFFNETNKSDNNYYRPLLAASFFFDTQTGDKNLAVFFFTNILFHILCTVLLLLFLNKIRLETKSSFLFALIFAVHPLLTQAIAWIPGRNDSMLFLFSVLSMYFLIDYFKNHKIIKLVLHVLFFSFSLLTKETAIVLPILYILLYLNQTNRIKFSELKTKIFKLKFLIILWFVISITFFVIRQQVIGNVVGLPFSYSLKHLILNLPAIVQYIGKMLFPFHLSTYPLIEDSPFIWGILTIGLTIFLLVKSKKTNYQKLIFGIIWLFIFILPAIIKTNDKMESSFLEHRMYLPIIGFFIILSETDFIKSINFLKRFHALLFLIFISFYVVICINHQKDYQNEYHYWESAVDASPHGSYAHFGLGTYYMISNQPNKAITEYKTTILLNKSLPNVHNNLGRIYLNSNSDSIAKPYFINELEINPNSAMANYNLGLIQFGEQNYDEAEKLMKKSLAINPDNIEEMNDLSVVLAQQGKYGESLHFCIKILDKDPNYSTSITNIKLLLLKLNKEEVEYYKNLLRNKKYASSIF